MTSNIEDELRAQVSEFAKSDESLKEIISRLGELDSLITAHQNSRQSLDSTTSSLQQLAANLGTLLTVSNSSVGEIAQVSTEIAGAVKRLEAEIASAIAQNIESVTEKIQLSVQHIEDVAKMQSSATEAVKKEIEAIRRIVEDTPKEVIVHMEEFESKSIQEMKKYAIRSQLVAGISALVILIALLVTS